MFHVFPFVERASITDKSFAHPGGGRTPHVQDPVTAADWTPRGPARPPAALGNGHADQRSPPHMGAGGGRGHVRSHACGRDRSQLPASPAGLSDTQSHGEGAACARQPLPPHMPVTPLSSAVAAQGSRVAPGTLAATGPSGVVGPVSSSPAHANDAAGRVLTRGPGSRC